MISRCIDLPHYRPTVHLAERPFPGGRIYAAALRAANSPGFHAAVVVMASVALGKRCELFRNEALLDGRVWLDPERALKFALEAGQAAVCLAVVEHWRLSVSPVVGPPAQRLSD